MTSHYKFIKYLSWLSSDIKAFVRYECETNAGCKFRHMEYVRVKREKLDRVEVYYGSLPTEI